MPTLPPLLAVAAPASSPTGPPAASASHGEEFAAVADRVARAASSRERPGDAHRRRTGSTGASAEADPTEDADAAGRATDEARTEGSVDETCRDESVDESEQVEDDARATEALARGALAEAEPLATVGVPTPGPNARPATEAAPEAPAAGGVVDAARTVDQAAGTVDAVSGSVDAAAGSVDGPPPERAATPAPVPIADRDLAGRTEDAVDDAAMAADGVDAAVVAAASGEEGGKPTSMGASPEPGALRAEPRQEGQPAHSQPTSGTASASAVGPSAVTAGNPPAAATPTSSSATEPGWGAPAPEGEPWEQLATVVRPLRQAPDGSHRLSLQLRPAELGTVHLEVALNDGRLSLRAVAENLISRDLLVAALPELRAELSSSGIDLGSLDVSDHTGAGAGGTGDHTDRPPTAAQLATRRGSGPRDGPTSTDARSATRAAAGQLDLVL